MLGEQTYSQYKDVTNLKQQSWSLAKWIFKAIEICQDANREMLHKSTSLGLQQTSPPICLCETKQRSTTFWLGLTVIQKQNRLCEISHLCEGSSVERHDENWSELLLWIWSLMSTSWLSTYLFFICVNNLTDSGRWNYTVVHTRWRNKSILRTWQVRQLVWKVFCANWNWKSRFFM